MPRSETFDDIRVSYDARYDKFAVHGFGIYDRNSVLAGQTKKVFLDWYDTEAEAHTAYPTANDGCRSANNTFGHLPCESDPVPGGMFPDDISDGW